MPEVGQMVRVRGRNYVVTHLKASQLGETRASTPLPGRLLVEVASLDDQGLGEEASFLWGIEPGAEVLGKVALPKPTGFDAPVALDTFLLALKWSAIASADDRTLQSPFRSGIEIEDYQLDPLARSLRMPRVNLLIADDVGLGKTIETGLVIQELLLRHRARTVLVVCPSGIQLQWQQQMWEKFGLEFRIIDTEALKALRRKRGLHVNPWTHFPRLITSMDFLKREGPLQLFRDTLPGEGQPTYPRPYDLLVVDEAHNVAPSGNGAYALPSLRTQAIRTLAPWFEHKLFLSATPHNGYRESFRALLELLDNQRFNRGLEPSPAQLQAVMVRRLKSELKLKHDGSRRFADRVVHPMELDYTAAERRAHQALRDYTAARLRSAASHAETFATEFVLKLLKKRLFSSPAALAVTLEKHAASVGAASASATLGALRRGAEDLQQDFANDDDLEEATGQTVDAASRLQQGLSHDERRLLDELRRFAQDASLRPDTKAAGLLRWLRATLQAHGAWNDTRVIVFTEYRDTQNWLFQLLASEGLAGGGRVELLYGGMDAKD
ncbi:MAG: DISARM system SNF2-like helicase DrmD, partial [Verrucomicrobiota bacterium]